MIRSHGIGKCPKDFFWKLIDPKNIGRILKVGNVEAKVLVQRLAEDQEVFADK